MPYDAFISYASADEARAEALYRRLSRFRYKGRRLRIAYAPASIPVGGSIPGQLIKLLGESHATVVVLTPHWKSSQWCSFEAEAAIWEDPSAKRGRLILCSYAETQLPAPLDRIKRLDLTSEYEAGLRQLVERIRQVLDERASEDEAARYLEKQKKSLMRSGLLPWVDGVGPNLEFIWPDLLVDPPVRRLRRPGAVTTLRTFIEANHDSTGTITIIAGEPGAGKSMAAKVIALDTVRPKGEMVRRLLHAREVGGAIPSSGANEWIIDGLDEAGKGLLPLIMEFAEVRAESGDKVWLCGRTDFLYKHLAAVSTSSDHLDEVIEILPWGITQIMKFTQEYVSKVGQPHLVGLVEGLVRDETHLEVLNNPMRLTLLLYLLTNGESRTQSLLAYPFHLYARFYDHWTRREWHRHTGGERPSEISVEHICIAKWLYQHRGHEYEVPSSVIEAMGDDSAFWGLLTWEERGSDFKLVYGFQHETIGEFLLARRLLAAMQSGGSAIGEALDVTVGDDVNVFIRSAFDSMRRAAVEGVRSNLESYYESLSFYEANDRPREQILYYLGRLPAAAPSGVLVKAWRCERTWLLRRAAALGAIIQGSSEVEEEFINSLSDPAHELVNRSVQLCYFGDVDADLHVYLDEGGDWSRTKSAILNRLGAESSRAMRLRWWDAETLASFARSRGEIHLLSSEIEMLREIASARGDKRQERVSGSVQEVLCVAVEVTPADASSDHIWTRW